jgi:hypothetical protein
MPKSLLLLDGALLLSLGVVVWLTPLTMWFSLPLALFFSSPWLAGIAWLISRVGWTTVSPEHDREFESQAKRLRSFGAR